MKMKRFEVRLEEWKYNLLKAQSQRERVSMASLVRKMGGGDKLDLGNELLELGALYRNETGR